jgi:hypothetical protein
MGGYDGVKAGVLPLGGSRLVIEALRLVSPLTFFGGPVSCPMPRSYRPRRIPRPVGPGRSGFSLRLTGVIGMLHTRGAGSSRVSCSYPSGPT